MKRALVTKSIGQTGRIGERNSLIAIRTPPSVDSTVLISSLNLRLPANHSWVIIPTNFWTGSDEGSADLYSAFERGLIEVKVEGQFEYPDWYLNVLTPNVRIPEEFLEEGDDETLSHMARLRKDAHPAIWAILRREFFTRELLGRNRESVTSFLQSDLIPVQED